MITEFFSFTLLLTAFILYTISIPYSIKSCHAVICVAGHRWLPLHRHAHHFHWLLGHQHWHPYLICHHHLHGCLGCRDPHLPMQLLFLIIFSLSNRTKIRSFEWIILKIDECIIVIVLFQFRLFIFKLFSIHKNKGKPIRSNPIHYYD